MTGREPTPAAVVPALVDDAVECSSSATMVEVAVFSGVSPANEMIPSTKMLVSREMLKMIPRLPIAPDNSHLSRATAAAAESARTTEARRPRRLATVIRG